MIGCPWILSLQESQLRCLLLIFSHVWLPGRVGLPADCLLQEMKSLLGKNSYRMRLSDKLGREEKALLIRGKAGFDSPVLCLFPSPALSACAYNRVLGRKETLNENKESTFFYKHLVHALVLLLHTHSHWGECWLLYLPWDSFCSWPGGSALLRPTQSQNLDSPVRLLEWSKHLASFLSFPSLHSLDRWAFTRTASGT